MRENLTPSSMRGSRRGLLGHQGDAEYALCPKGRGQARGGLKWLGNNQSCSLLCQGSLASTCRSPLAPNAYRTSTPTTNFNRCQRRKLTRTQVEKYLRCPTISFGRSAAGRVVASRNAVLSIQLYALPGTTDIGPCIVVEAGVCFRCSKGVRRTESLWQSTYQSRWLPVRAVLARTLPSGFE